MPCVTDGHPLPNLQISEIDKLTITPVGLEDENFIVYLGLSYFFNVCDVMCVYVCLYE